MSGPNLPVEPVSKPVGPNLPSPSGVTNIAIGSKTKYSISGILGVVAGLLGYASFDDFLDKNVFVDRQARQDISENSAALTNQAKEIEELTEANRALFKKLEELAARPPQIEKTVETKIVEVPAPEKKKLSWE